MLAAADVLGLDADGALVAEVRSGLNATLDEFE
ncbi:phosphohydrolase [Haloferax sp. BAB-2207]|nr:phosphohydrolase [Haloferax sp. BAB-2207]